MGMGDTHVAKWVLKTRRRRGRCSVVQDFRRLDPSRVEITWAATWDDAKVFPTRAAAIAFREMVQRETWLARKWVAVNKAAKQRKVADFKPRSTVDATPAEAERIALAVTSAREHAARAGLTLPEFKVFVTTGRRSCRGGRHRDGLFYISLDRWAFERDSSDKPGYLTYIVAHELAHVADVYHTGRTSHGPQFMAHLRKLCPLHLQAYELNYKPTEARRAGISLRDASPEVAAAVKPRREFPPPNIVRLLEKAAAELKAEGVIG